jgi:hypothetical protein
MLQSPDTYDDDLDDLPPYEPVRYAQRALLGALLFDPAHQRGDQGPVARTLHQCRP